MLLNQNRASEREIKRTYLEMSKRGAELSMSPVNLGEDKGPTMGRGHGMVPLYNPTVQMKVNRERTIIKLKTDHLKY